MSADLKKKNLVYSVLSYIHVTHAGIEHKSVFYETLPTDRPKSVCNRCVIEVFGGVYVVTLLLDFSVSVGASVIGMSQISSFFPLFY